MKDKKLIDIYIYLRKNDFVVYSINKLSKDLKLNWRTTQNYINLLESLGFKIYKNKKEYNNKLIIELQDFITKYDIKSDLDILTIRKIIKVLKIQY